MTPIESIMRTVAATAKNVAQTALPGAKPVVSAIEALGKAFDHLKAANGGTAPAQAEVDRDEALAIVLKHAETTARRLEGKK